ncbi:MAG: alpha/beta hydrolase-fold protein [Bifidobacterium sp.]|uniref:Alpha/beta hydrolase-fold protein n=1 Tax=Bifidobacterium fermentum TaxID=3059035 RepID=A0AB39UCK9_9BIFI
MSENTYNDDIHGDIHGAGESSPDAVSLIGEASTVIPGHFGDPVRISHALRSNRNAQANPAKPLFLLLHGWGSNERDLADLMQYIAPFNDYIGLRAPLDMPSQFGQGGYTWFHDCVPTGASLDRDAYAASLAIDSWIDENIDSNREIVPLGFSQGGVLAVHLLRVHPERYRAAISLSGFLAPKVVADAAPADERLAALEVPVFYGYGKADNIIPKYEIYGMAAWLEEHTWLKSCGYPGLDHAVSLDEFNDIRQWLSDNNIASGVM